MSPHNMLNTPVLCSSSHPKTPQQHRLQLGDTPNYSGKQLKPVPQHLELDLLNPKKPSTGELLHYISGLNGRSSIYQRVLLVKIK